MKKRNKYVLKMKPAPITLDEIIENLVNFIEGKFEIV